jgi:hypothetical protein
MKSLVQYFGCGIYSEASYSGPVSIFTVNKFKDLEEKIISFFDKYPLQGSKALDFADFRKAAEIMKTKSHLTVDGLEEIRKIKAGMNRGRK